MTLKEFKEILVYLKISGLDSIILFNNENSFSSLAINEYGEYCIGHSFEYMPMQKKYSFLIRDMRYDDMKMVYYDFVFKYRYHLVYKGELADYKVHSKRDMNRLYKKLKKVSEEYWLRDLGKITSI